MDTGTTYSVSAHVEDCPARPVSLSHHHHPAIYPARYHAVPIDYCHDCGRYVVCEGGCAQLRAQQAAVDELVAHEVADRAAAQARRERIDRRVFIGQVVLVTLAAAWIICLIIF